MTSSSGPKMNHNMTCEGAIIEEQLDILCGWLLCLSNLGFDLTSPVSYLLGIILFPAKNKTMLRRGKVNLAFCIQVRASGWGGWGVKCYPYYSYPSVRVQPILCTIYTISVEKLHRFALNVDR